MNKMHALGQFLFWYVLFETVIPRAARRKRQLHCSPCGPGDLLFARAANGRSPAPQNPIFAA